MAYRKFDTGTWEDKRFEKLSPMERYLFIYLWTNSQCNQSGMYEITLRRMEFETKIPSTDLEPLLKGLAPMVQWWSTDEVIFIPNFLKRQCQNKQFAEGALKMVLENWPEKVQVFINSSKTILDRYKIDPPKIVQPPLNPPSCPTEAVTEAVTEADILCSERSGDNSEPQPKILLEIPLIKKDGMFSVSQADIDEWQDTFPGIDAMAEVKKYRQWAKDNPAKRKTAGGIRKSITHWLSKAQDQGRGVKGPAQPPPGNPQDSMENKTAWLRSQTKETLEKLAQNGNIAAFNVLKERGEAVPLEAV